MKVYYHSALIDMELMPEGVFRTIPCKAYLKLHKDKSETPYELLCNGTIINPNTEEIECNEECDLIIRQAGNNYVYSIRPSVQPLSTKFAKAYEQFFYEYSNKEFDEISSIQIGSLKLYAVDQSAEVYDWTEVFNHIENAFNAFKKICEKPKTHLKAVNEVRPIETVKRIGYESIPYLAAHSEDWLARTASGLKPARLFSRVEDDEFQIYENRVVKTLIDLILVFLRKIEKQMRDQRDQLHGIMNSSVQTGSFGFDVSYQRAVSELMSSDDKGDEYRAKSLETIENLQKRAYYLLKRYRTLRQTKLYRYLKKSKTVSNPLNETNILVMDKYYSVIFKLWKEFHHVVVQKAFEEENQIAFDDMCNDYQRFCATLCGYAAHVMGFDLIDDGKYFRTADHIELMVDCSEDGNVRLVLFDKESRVMEVPGGVDIPIAAGMESYGFSYDGRYLSWPNDVSDTEIDSFCSMFKTRESRGREQSEEKRKYNALKVLINQQQRIYQKPGKANILIIPVTAELGTENRASFKASMESIAMKCYEDNPDEQIVVALPLCNESEQKLVNYAKEDGEVLAVLPLTMFDINSFRRIQNILYRKILKLDKGRCPNCGENMRKHDNQQICDACSQLTLTKTVCPNPDCRNEYLYMGYDVAETTIQKMQMVEKENFFQWDSLYQYKDIVNMAVTSGKVRTVCPCCHKS